MAKSREKKKTTNGAKVSSKEAVRGTAKEARNAGANGGAPDLGPIISQIEAVLKKKFPNAYKSLSEPRPPSLAMLEKAVGSLPSGVRQLYEWKDGGSDFLKGEDHDVDDCGLDWYSASGAIASRKIWLELRAKDAAFTYEERLLPLFTDGAGNDLCVDIASARLDLFDVDHETREITKRGSLEQALQHLFGAIKSGRWRASEAPAPIAKTMAAIEKDLRGEKSERGLERLDRLLGENAFEPVRDIVRRVWDDVQPRHYTAYQLADYEAQACRSLQDEEGAFQAAKRLHDADPTFADRLWKELTPWFVERKRMDYAGQSARFAATLQSEDFELAVTHAKLLLAAGNGAEANEVLSAAIDRGKQQLIEYSDDVPSCVQLNVELAEAWLLAGDEESAALAWREARAKDPERALGCRTDASERTPGLATLE